LGISLAEAPQLDDAEMPAAVAGALRGEVRNNGQSCIAANRIYVAAGIYEEFLTAYGDAIRRLELGHNQACGRGPAH